MRRRAALLLAWTTLLVAAGALLICMGRGQLALPASPSMSAVRVWAASRDPATLVMCAVRVLSLVLDGYLLMTTVAGAAARAARCASAVRVLDVLTPSSVRRVLAVSMSGLILSTPLVVPGGRWDGATFVAAAAPPLAPLPSVIVLGPVASGPPLARIGPAQVRPPSAVPRREEPVLRPDEAAPRLDEPTTPSPTETTAATPGTAPEVTNATPEIPPNAALDSWVVHPRDNLWRIARVALAARGRPAATAAEIAPFWASLVAANRERFRNPSLLYAGQTVVIPP
jgi:hypothetical protein